MLYIGWYGGGGGCCWCLRLRRWFEPIRVRVENGKVQAGGNVLRRRIRARDVRVVCVAAAVDDDDKNRETMYTASYETSN